MKINLDDGFAFGLGLFETIAVKNNHCIMLEQHLQRLQNSMNFFSINQMVDHSQIEKYLQQNNLENSALKIMVSQHNLLITHRPNPYQEQDYCNGFSLDYSSVYRNETSPFTYHKTLNYGDNIREKRLGTTDEPLFLNSKGQITEGATTNIFFVKEKMLYTPPIACGMLNGIMRQYICQNYQVSEKIILPNNISEFEQCFVTNSLLGIIGVRSIANHQYYSLDYAQTLQEKYLKKHR